jgi:putative ABC transport system permease protein
MGKQKLPPKLADQLLDWFCKSELLEGIKGDLDEYWEKIDTKGWKARMNYWLQILSIMRPFALKRFGLLQNYRLSMIRFNILLGVRNMRRNKFYATLNILGLSVAIISCIFISLYVLDEKSYDQHWQDAEQIHRVTHYNERNGNKQYKDIIRTQIVIGDYLKTDFPEVLGVGRISRYLHRKIAKEGQWIEQSKIGITEQDFLDLYSFKPLHGDINNALEEINSIVLTESVAKKYFNKSDVVGQSILMNDSSQYKITCVIEDIPKNAHFQYSAFLNNGAMQRAKRTWAYVGCITYVKINPMDRPKLEAEIFDMILDYGAKDWEEAYGVTDVLDYLDEQGHIWRIDLIPITDIHLNSTNRELEVSGKGNYLIILQFVGGFLALIAVFNFINLTTAKASNRLKEVVIKRVLGSQKKQLLAQFLTESFLYALIATAVAIFTSYALIEEFNALSKKSFSDPFFNPFGLWKYVLPMTVVLGLLAGAYPAFYLSRMKTMDTSEVVQSGIKSQVRSICVILQFAISAVLIFGSMAVIFQLKYLDSKDLGFDPQGNAVFYMDHLRLGQSNFENDPKRILFANELKKSPYFSSISSTSLVPMLDIRGNTGSSMFSTHTRKGDPESLPYCQADHNLIPTLGLELLKGRNFRTNEPEGVASALLTESAVKLLALEDPIGSSIYHTISDTELKIVGIVKDFNFVPLHRDVEPLIIMHDQINDQTIAKFESENLVEAISEAEKIWFELFPNYPMTYDLLSDLHARHYDEEKRMGKILLIGTLLVIFIACLGLFGLSTYSTERRKKEIGIRKVFGATNHIITSMLVKGFTKPIFIALIVGIPIAYYVTQSWLDGFAHRISIGWALILSAGLLTLSLGVLTVGYISYKSAAQNPADNLRYE